ncbi:family 78 glycoside hydrolase catalytic domain [Paenibacillus qinlingensis]|uniref:alpha-L-rhamnosidase n=1 Tax=Paenibacillus qinlingensis TaxID=1837343 RepID=A0ABU1NUP6_9BACL|nr:family 78 glycoside hydrolase catalytic domain [Paenibacillus qinlingensis]MDR6551189.1 alpha-L-rhamnosidase [Paenibacillus qinlingensis]
MSFIRISTLHCEYRVNPLGLDTAQPRFTWQIETDINATLQAAYHLQVSTHESSFDPAYVVWDTDRIASDQSVLIVYEGPELQSRTRYFYRVKVWNQSGVESPWSETAYWEMGQLQASEWQAEWITPDSNQIDPDAEEAYYLRKTFAVRESVSKATIYATSHGVYELELNGSRVGDWEMTPGWTSYKHRLQVQSYDVTNALTVGTQHTIGAVLANGWYKGNLAWTHQRNIYGSVRALLLQIHIVYEDGTEEVILSDSSWRASLGPVRMSELYHGETYDAGLELTGWSLPSYTDTSWASVTVLNESKETLVMQENEPSRVTEQVQPIAVLETPLGETVLDFGQNMVGKVQLRVSLPAGSRIELLHAEVLDAQGNFYIGNLRSAKQQVIYVCSGRGEETYAPHFSFQGFRYVKVVGWPQDVAFDAAAFTGLVIHTDMTAKGSFECSNTLLNQLQRNIVWGQRGNFLDVPTDCPQRDERLGWTGDAQVFIRTAAFNYEVALFFSKWLRDLKADQREDGGVPFVIPHVLNEKDHSSAAWGDAAVICPWTLYQVYGDKRVLEEQYESMKGWINYIRQQGENEFLWQTGFHFGDWLGLDAKEGSYIGATPKDLIATCFYAYSTSLFVKTAEVLGHTADVAAYTALYERIVDAFTAEFVTPSGRLAGHTQTSHVLPLMFGLVQGSTKERLAATLAAYVKEQNYHLTTGFVGTPYLCHVLSENGYHDVAVKLVLQEDYPSWLYPIHQGATTIWEHWDGIKPDGTFWSDDMNSYNHYAYGSIGDWLYRKVAGLDSDDQQPGYKRVLFRPRPDSSLTYAKASLVTNYGEVRSEWQIEEDGAVNYTFQLPPNTSGDVLLRGTTLTAVTCHGQKVTGISALHGAQEVEGHVCIELGSGVYHFRVESTTTKSLSF